jgi:hypothetical protein
VTAFVDRLRDWLARYGPAECGGLVLAFAASFGARHMTRSAIVAGYAAAWGETIGYASVMVLRDFIAETRAAHSARHGAVRHAGNVAVGLATEFGPAGVIDTFITRPFAMTLGVRLLGPVLGLVVGKLSADVLFYAPVIYTYEWRKRRRARMR